MTFVSAFPLAGNPFYVTLECTAKAEAQKLGIDLSEVNPALADVKHELPLLQAAIAAKPKVIILASIDRTALAPTVHQAMAQGIKFIYVDQLPSDLSGAASVLRYDVKGLGVKDAQVLASAMHHKGEAIEVTGPPGIPTVQTIHQGYLEGLSGSGVTNKATLYDPTMSASNAATQVASALSADPKIGGINAWIDIMSDGALAAVRQTGRTSIPIVTNYTNYQQLQQLAAGQFVALIGLPAGQLGTDAVDQAQNVLTGKPTTPLLTLPTFTITKTNINSPAAKPYEYVKGCS